MTTSSKNADKQERIHNNVDSAEIAKFERMASRWWDKDGDFKPLHEINPLRANYIDERAPVAAKKILDIGCGGGILCEALAQRGAEVTGIDLGEAPLEVAKLHRLESALDIDYRKISAEELAESKTKERLEQSNGTDIKTNTQADNRYDIVTCLEMLEHVPDPSQTVKACAELCKPGGDLFFSTINRNPKSYLFAIIGAEYVLKLLPKGTHEYKKFIRPSELASSIRKAELVLNDMCGMVYNPLTKKYKLQQNDVDVNYIVHAKKIQPNND